jgi:hypothetical protein
VSGTTSGVRQLSLLPTNWLDSGSTALLTVHPNASFSVVQTGQNVDIEYQAVPEPAACAVAAFGVSGVVAASLRRWRRRRAATVAG